MGVAPVPSAREAMTVQQEAVRENWRLRQNLALSYRLLDDMALNEVPVSRL